MKANTGQATSLFEGRCRYIGLAVQAASVILLLGSVVHFCTAGLFAAILSGVHDAAEYQGSLLVIVRALLGGCALAATGVFGFWVVRSGRCRGALALASGALVALLPASCFLVREAALGIGVLNKVTAVLAVASAVVALGAYLLLRGERRVGDADAADAAEGAEGDVAADTEADVMADAEGEAEADAEVAGDAAADGAGSEGEAGTVPEGGEDESEVEGGAPAIDAGGVASDVGAESEVGNGDEAEEESASGVVVGFADEVAAAFEAAEDESEADIEFDDAEVEGGDDSVNSQMTEGAPSIDGDSAESGNGSGSEDADAPDAPAPEFGGDFAGDVTAAEPTEEGSAASSADGSASFADFSLADDAESRAGFNSASELAPVDVAESAADFAPNLNTSDDIDADTSGGPFDTVDAADHIEWFDFETGAALESERVSDSKQPRRLPFFRKRGN